MRMESKQAFLFRIYNFFISEIESFEGCSDLDDVVEKVNVFFVLFYQSLKNYHKGIEAHDIVIQSNDGDEEVDGTEIEDEVE